MIRTGLVSVTFRKLAPEEIVDLSLKAGIQGIEWGGDIHVPHGNPQRAREVAQLTRDNGLTVAAYGSYYSVGCPKPDVGEFDSILETAVALGAPTIRVWAGKGSKDADDVFRDKVVHESREIADLAEKEGIRISFEYHGGTLTDTNDSAVKLMREINHRNVYIYWQVSANEGLAARQNGLRLLLPKLDHIHVFHWKHHERLPLLQGQEEWLRYLKLIDQLSGDRFAMLEFVKDDDPAQFLEDAQALQNLLKMIEVSAKD